MLPNKKYNSLKHQSLIKQVRKVAISGLLVPCLIANSFLVMADDSLPSKNSNDNNVYPASFFNQYLPQNALEMIERLPGFKFDQGSNERGFGGNAGNVLIDGKRPTSKSGGLSGALVRIPAVLVERIEILRGGVSAGEAAGQSVVANIIRKVGGTSGRWAAKLRRAPGGKTLPNIEAAISTHLGNWQTSFDIDIGGGPGYRSAVVEDRDANNLLTASSKESLIDSGQWIFANAEGATSFARGELTLNSRIGGDHYKADTIRESYNGRLPDNSPFESFWELNEKREFEMAELSADWTRKVGDWKWHAIGLGLLDDVHYENKSHSDELLTNELTDSRYAQDSVKTEIISRLTYGYAGKNAFKPEFGIEVARNKLTSEYESFENGSQEQSDDSDVVVKELRTEIFTSFIYPFNDQLSIEGGLTGEFSKIRIFNPNGLVQEQEFKFLKPRLSATYTLDKQSRLTFEVGRKVGQ
jgi:outer membrane receptor protein involved in Fe transport